MADIAHLTVIYESQGYDKVKGEVESLKQAGAQVEAASSKAATGTQRAGEAAAVAVGASSQRVRALTQQMSGLERTVRGLGDVFKHAFGGLIAFGAVAAIAEFGRSIVDANADMQKMLNTLNAASGSMEQAKGEFSFLADLANKLGTDLQGSADGYARLAVSARAAGISTSQLHTSFTGLSEGFAATGRSGDEMNRFLVQLEQGLSQGTIQMRDLRAMAQSFPAAFEIAGEAAKRMGGSLDSFLKHGGLPAEQFFVTFSEIVHEKFAKAAEEASNTLVGQLNRIKNALFESKTGADALAPLTAALKALADELNSDSGQKHIADLVESIVTGFKAALAAVTLFIKVLPTLIVALNTLVVITGTKMVVALAASIAKRLVLVGLIEAQTVATVGLITVEKAAEMAAARSAVAMTGAAVASRGLSAALALVGGIPGLIVLGVAAIGYAIYRAATEVDRMKEAFSKVEDKMKSAQAQAVETAKALRDAANAFGNPDPNVKAIGTTAALGASQDAQKSQEQTAAAIAEQTAKVADYTKQLAAAKDAQERLVARGLSASWSNPKIVELSREVDVATGSLNALKQQYDDTSRAAGELAGKTMNALVPALKSAYAVGSQSGGIVGGLKAAVQSAIDFVNNNPIDAFVNAKNKALSLTEGLVEKAANLGKKQSQIIKEAMDTVASTAKASNTDATKLLATLQAGYQAQLKIEAAQHKGGVPKESASGKLLQSISERIQAEKLLQAEMEKSGGDVSKLTEGQKMLIKFNTELGTTYKGTTAAQAENIRVQLNGLIASEKATQAAKDHAAALKKQADALAEVNKIGNTAAAKASANLGQAVLTGMGGITGNRHGASRAAGEQAQLAAQQGQLAKTEEATKAYKAATEAVTLYGKSLDDLAIAQKASSSIQEFIDSQDPNAQYERSIEYVQTYIGFLKQLTAEQVKAFSPKQLAAYHKQLEVLPKILSQMKTQLAGIKLETAAKNVAAGLQSLQSLSKEGSKSYKEMQVAIDAANIAAAVGAILNQGMGDPYTAFARMAAMAALVATFVGDVGAVGSSYSGNQSAEYRQAHQGTGTVLGDATKQSQSIANAVTLTADSTSKLVGINTGMRDALINLQKALESAGVLIAQGASSTAFPSFKKDVNPINGIISSLDILGGDPITKAVSSFLFGGKKTLVDQGIEIMGGALNSMLDQVVVGAYQTIHKSGGLFGSSKTYDVTQAVSGDISTQFGLVMKSIVDTVTQAAKALGIPLGDIQQKIAAFQVATQHISLKGLSAEDQNKAIEAVFSKIFDDLAASVVPFVKQFQKVGEGMAETLVRVATDVQTMQRAVQTLGFSITTSDPEKFAQVSVALVELMGGAQQFIDGMNSFISDFAPDTVKLQQAHDQLTSALKQVGLALPDTRDGMWKLMQSLDATTTAGQQQIAVLLQLADVSNNYYTMLEQGVGVISKAAQDLATKLYGSLGGSLDAISAKLDELKGKTQSALGVALGGNSPLSAQEQLNLSLKGLASGLTTIDQVLAIGKKLYRGADYTKLYQQVMASQGMGTGGVGDIGAAVDQYNSLFAQQQALQKQKDAMGRFNDAKQLADYVVQMAKNQGKSYQDIATSLGFNLSGLGKDLGVSNIIGYLDKLTLEGAGTGKEQVAALNTLNSTANSQLTTLKSIDQRLRNIEDSNEKTANNTGKQASQGTTTALRHTASTTRMVPA